MIKKCDLLSWGVIASLIPIIGMPLYVWGQAIDWQIFSVSVFQLFPLLGLLAFVIMWWHFLIGFIGSINRGQSCKELKSIHSISSKVVFVLILLHPILLALALSNIGLGLPPESYRTYVGAGNSIFVTYGTLALSAFLLYDLARWLKKKKWVSSNWSYIDAVDDVAFVAIFFHGLYLGQHLQSGWLKTVWLLLGVSAGFFIVYKHYRTLSEDNKDEAN